MEAGIPPQVAWARVSACSECLLAEEVRQASSGLAIRATSIDWWQCWQTSRSGATRIWLQPMIFGKCGGHGNEASGAGGNQHMSPWRGERQRSATLWPGQAAHYNDLYYKLCFFKKDKTCPNPNNPPLQKTELITNYP